MDGDDDHELASLLDPNDRSSSPFEQVSDDGARFKRTSRYRGTRRIFSSLCSRAAWRHEWVPRLSNAWAHIVRIVKRRVVLVILATALLTLTLFLYFSSLSPYPFDDEWEWDTWDAWDEAFDEGLGIEDGTDPTRPQRMRTMDTLSGACLEAWVARGDLCAEEEGLVWMRWDMSHAKLDAVWTWVNGSDPRHAIARDFWAKQPVGTSIYEVDPPHLLDHETAFPKRDSDDDWDDDDDDDSDEDDDSDDDDDDDDEDEDPKPNKKGKWFREHDELKYSMRSAATYLRNDLRRMHVVATDFRHPLVAPSLPSSLNLSSSSSRPVDSCSGTSTRTSPGVDYRDVGFTDPVRTPDDRSNCGAREGQWPQWMDPALFFDTEGRESRNGSRKSKVHHHWNLFSLPDDSSKGEGDWTNWKNHVLPTFNSYAIESQIVNLEGLHEIFIYNNDDFFFNQHFSVSDFYTPLYGQVFRLQPGWGVDAVENDPSDASGEGPQLRRSAWLLSQRFGERSSSRGTVRRPYIEHTTKTYTLPLLRETRLMFPQSFEETSTHRFRGVGQDMVAVYLANHLTVERHREALLWSFFVARGDTNGDGWVGREELSTLVAFLVGEEGTIKEEGKVLKVLMPRRTTLKDMQATLEEVGMRAPQRDTILYTSQDGSPYYRPLGESKGWPQVYGSRPNVEMCTLDLGACLPEYFDDTNEEGILTDRLMKRFAFERPECGDCAIVRLTDLSGSKGMSAFLPPNNTYFPLSTPPRNPSTMIPRLRDSPPTDASNNDTFSTTAPRPEPPPVVAHLPIGPRWQDLDFSLSAVQHLTGWPAARTRREFAMTLIQRYSYVTAVSPFHYIQLTKPEWVRGDLRSVTKRGAALVCIQDDIVDPKGRETIDDTLASWFEKTFPQRLPFERP